MPHTDSIPVVHMVDDDDTFRSSIDGLLVACGYEVRSYASAEEYLSNATPGPGCLLLDVNMPGLSGLELQARLLALGQYRPIVFLSGQGDIPMTVQALRAGAEDFLTKPVARAALVDAIDRAMDRDSAAHTMAVENEDLLARFARLTPRERDVLEKMMLGLLNKQIAYNMQTAERTVKGHRSQIMQKLGTRALPELTRLYDQYRLLLAEKTARSPDKA